MEPWRLEQVLEMHLEKYFIVSFKYIDDESSLVPNEVGQNSFDPADFARV
jgi:hypothetical protein